jgi:hypothetical protein
MLHNRLLSRFLVGSVVLAFASSRPILRGDTFTWDNGGATTNWGTANNWDPNDEVPGSGDVAVLGTAGSVADLFSTSYSIGSVIFNRAADFEIRASGTGVLTIETFLNATAPEIPFNRQMGT